MTTALESILSDLARVGGSSIGQDQATCAKHCAAAVSLIAKGAYDKQTKQETDPESVSLLVALFVDATRQRISDDEFASTCGDYLAKIKNGKFNPTKILAQTFAENRVDVFGKLHSSFFVDLPHVVGVSSSVLHHVRDFALTGSTNEMIKMKKRQQHEDGGGAAAGGADDAVTEVIGVIQPDVDEKPRSVANFVFSLDLASRGILNLNNQDEAQQEQSSSNNKSIAFQCTAEQAMELANSLRAAANALQRVENRAN
jgi:hypothetical protein